jgi:MinD-like ATPase involved in chromosome partitioning or flagellar assembly
MTIAVWAVRGGSGVSTVSALLIRFLCSKEASAGQAVIAIDAGGDLPALFGVAPGSGEGLSDWLAADQSVDVEALDGLLIGDGVQILPIGHVEDVNAVGTEVGRERLDHAIGWLTNRASVVCDLGHSSAPLAEALIAQADRSVLVIRPCMLSVRTALRSPRPAHGMVIVGAQPGDMRAEDMEAALGIPVLATVPELPALARAVNQSNFSGRLPHRALRAMSAVIRP